MDNNGGYSKADIVQTLKSVGVGAGDALFCHSNIGFFGFLIGAQTKEDYYKNFNEAIFEVIGPDGTLIAPTFTYSFCRDKIFDKFNTPSVCGLFSEMVRSDPKALRSDDANFSISAIGKNARYLAQSAPVESFGKNSFWDKFLAANGKICNFNFDSGSTFIHYIEKKLKVPYRYDKAFSGISIVDGRTVKKEFIHFVYDHNIPENAPEFTKFDKAAKTNGLAKTANLGKGQIVMITAVDTEKLINEQLKANPNFLIRGGN